ncbi:MAG TPA: outer membrane protein assembly factor BamD [Pseudomonadales bacterium]|nr:outer membrane protein assembly factor BamD [Pseudomonadales bacterium]
MKARHAKGSRRLPFGVLLLLAVVAPLAGGCADSTGDALQQDVAQLRQDLNALTLSVHRGRGDTEAVLSQLDRRAREGNAESSRQMGALSARVDTLSTELTRVSARLDELSQRIETLSRELASRAAPAPSSGGSAPGTAGAPPSSGGPTPQQAYQAAYLDFSKGNYPLAVAGFREFVRRYPDAPLADQAQYWVGESLFSQARASLAAGQSDKATRELEQAVQEFRRVSLNYPRGDKVPTALYKEALALLELKQPRLAQTRLQYLLDNFPQSEEAPLAKERLANLGG